MMASASSNFVYKFRRSFLPELYAHVPVWLRPLFASSLTLSTILAVLLNQLLRLGNKEAKPVVEITEVMTHERISRWAMVQLFSTTRPR
jgi:xanthine/uracil permease